MSDTPDVLLPFAVSKSNFQLPSSNLRKFQVPTWQPPTRYRCRCLHSHSSLKLIIIIRLSSGFQLQPAVRRLLASTDHQGTNAHGPLPSALALVDLRSTTANRRHATAPAWRRRGQRPAARRSVDIDMNMFTLDTSQPSAVALVQ